MCNLLQGANCLHTVHTDVCKHVMKSNKYALSAKYTLGTNGTLNKIITYY